MPEEGPAPPVVHCAVLRPAAGRFSRSAFAVTILPAAANHRIRWAQLLIGAATDGGGHPFCLLHLDLLARQLWLYGDDGCFVGPASVGVPTAGLQNAFCAVNSAATNAAMLGPSLVFTTDIAFKQASTSPLRIYLRCEMDDAAKTDWVAAGGPLSTEPWAGAPPIVRPNAGSGGQAEFTICVQDPSAPLGAAGGWSEFLIASSPDAEGESFCFVHFDHADHKLWMYSSEAGYFIGPVSAGEQTGLLTSNACDVVAERVRVGMDDGRCVMHVPVVLKAPMVGSKKIFLRTQDALGRDSGWIESGAWVVP